MASIFESIHVGNFNGQRGSDRFPPDRDPTSPSQSPPSPAQWRANVVALSQHFNLYFASFGIAIHITVPRDLHQSLPSVPHLVLHLPTSAAALQVGGYMPHTHPHTINHIKVGELGNFEILLIACDDGDVMAYYTRLLDTETTRRDGDLREAPVSLVEPFFHQNVGRSAWGLAIHQQSRLIAVSSNLWEVTVYHHALAAEHDTYSGRWKYRRRLSDSIELLSDEAYDRAALSYERAFSHVHSLSLETRANNDMVSGGYNSKMTIFLGPTGDNIPSIDFASDEDGEAIYVLATDIKGNLWSLNLCTRETIRSPPPQASLNHMDLHPEDVLRGWGVMYIPLSCFKHASTPQEAFGFAKIKDILHLSDEWSPPQNHKFLDISAANYQIAIPSHMPSRHHSSTLLHAVLHQAQSAELVLDNESEQHKNLARDSPKWVLDHLKSPTTASRYMTRPSNLPFLSERSWRAQLISILESGRWGRDVERWLNSLQVVSKSNWFSPAALAKDVEAFRFLCNLTRLQRYRIRDWDVLNIAAHNFQVLGDVQAALTSIETNPPTPPPPNLSTSLPLIPGCAILRTTHRDIELLPQHSTSIPTIIQGFASQIIHDPGIRHRLTIIDRLNMLALIPELSLLIVATQSGRVGVFTLTRLGDGFCDGGPVVSFRLETVLPLAGHEKEWRPNFPLLGMAVAPLQGVDDVGGGSGGAGQRRIWRVVLHYMDHSVLSYEVKRGDDGDHLVIL